MLLHNILDASLGGLCPSLSFDVSTQVDGVSAERHHAGNIFPLAFFFFFNVKQHLRR